jgi:hypothetical protein
MPVYRLAILLALLAGCASPPTVREFFETVGPELSAPQRTNLLETMEILFLVEDYLSALKARDGEGLAALLSADFHYGEHDRDWFREKTERELFRPYSALQAAASGIRLLVVRKEASPWIRQSEFDWLNGPGGGRTFDRPYLIAARSPSPFSVLIPSGPSAAAPASSGRRSRAAPVGVEAQFVDDPAATETIGEASFPLVLIARREGGGEVAIEESVVLLLEKEEGEWKIISVE